MDLVPLRRIGLAVTMLATATAALAESPLPFDQDDRMEDLGRYAPPWFAELQDVEIQGDLAYVFGVGGMAVFDLTNPNNPVELGRYEPPGHPYNRFYRGAVSGNLVAGGAREDLLTLIDVTTPSLLTVTAIHGQFGHSYEGMTIEGDLLYACRHDMGLEILNVANATSPQVLGEVTTLQNSWDVAVAGGVAYVADGGGGLAVIDVSTPTAPVHVASMPTSGSAADVVVSGGVAAVCVGSAGMDLFDLSAPLAPVLVGSVNTSGLAITAAIAGSVLYVADWDDVEMFDISNPATASLIGGEDTPVRAMGLDATEDLVVVADWSQLRTYRPGPTNKGDIHVTVEGLYFEEVPLGGTAFQTYTIGNTGGAAVTVNSVTEYGAAFEVLDAGPFTIFPGQTQDVTVSFTNNFTGYDATYMRILSTDADENNITFPLQADDNPNNLDIGESAPIFSHTDLGQVVHNLADYKGRIVVMAFFADW